MFDVKDYVVEISDAGSTLLEKAKKMIEHEEHMRENLDERLPEIKMEEKVNSELVCQIIEDSSQ